MAEKEIKIDKDENSAMYWLAIITDNKAESFLFNRQELNKLRAEIENELSE